MTWTSWFVDYPGYGFSEGSPTVDGLARASLRIYDFMAARWPHAEGPIFVYGHSMGTAFALHVGLNRPGTPVILEAPLTSVQDLAAAIKQRVPWYARLFLTIKIDPELTRWRQPVDMIPQLVGPLLIIHGTDDHTIPFAQGKRLFEAATTKQKHFCALAGEGHSPVEPDRDRRTDLGCLAAFLDAYGDAVRPSVGAPAQAAFRLKLCTEAPIHLEGPPGAQQSRGCVVTFTQELSDPAIIRWVGANRVERRYLVYAPANLPPNPAPVVLVFPGSSASAESVAFHTTHTRFETLGRSRRIHRRVRQRTAELSRVRGETDDAQRWFSSGLLSGTLGRGCGRHVCSSHPRPTGNRAKDRSLARVRDRAFRRRRHVLSIGFGGSRFGGCHCSSGGPSLSTQWGVAWPLPSESQAMTTFPLPCSLPPRIRPSPTPQAAHASMQTLTIPGWKKRAMLARRNEDPRTPDN